MQVGFVIALMALVLVGGVAICVGWWKLADTWFPGASRKTGQNISFGHRRQERPATGATVIKGFDREPPDDHG